ncbi:FHA domain-containing protein [Altericista sp. CCNU0014]|uniref:FHA domain-containing protein n=1 Tax=Altericista sp. CCNU0014 TaxID=3082949 RepID=UPI00385093E3
MIVCSNCLHHNLDEASYCEACGSKLPEMKSCSNCGSPVLDNAHFCGNCGFNLKISAYQRVESIDAKATGSDIVIPMPFPPEPSAELDAPAGSASYGVGSNASIAAESALGVDAAGAGNIESAGDELFSNTQIQAQSATLIHSQSNTAIALPDGRSVVHIGKPNDRVPPDINVSVFPSAEVVSRVHAAIHIEGGHFFVEDVGSANGTYLNNMPLTPSTRYRLRVGDRITLGKGDLVTFIFKTN